MKFNALLAVAAATAALAATPASAIPVIGGTTAVQLTAAATLTGAGVTVGGLGTAIISAADKVLAFVASGPFRGVALDMLGAREFS